MKNIAFIVDGESEKSMLEKICKGCKILIET